MAVPVTTAVLLTTALLMPAQATSDPFDAAHAAHAAQSNGDYTTAIRLYGEALQSGGLGPANQARVYLSRGNARAAIGLFEKAAADYNDAVRIDSGEV
ncbi:MAG: tetratricopeptide (TPR) repeat protein [Gammaproteobacteria bacterium]